MCRYCSMIKAKDKAAFVYEDEKAIAFLHERPASPGHLLVMPKEHIPSLDDAPDELIHHLFNTSSIAATAVFEGLGAEATNIILNEGLEKESNHLCVQIIPRSSDDELPIKWEPKKLSDNEMDDIRAKIEWEFIPPEAQQKKQDDQQPHLKVITQEQLDKAKGDEESRRMKHLIDSFQKIP